MSRYPIQKDRLTTALLLDAYSGAAVAYSVRKLRRGYAGSCLRLRRTSDNTELDIPFSSLGWIDAPTVTSWIANAPIINASLLNGGFETAGGGGADAFGSWTENVAGTSTVNRDLAVFHAGVAACRLDIDAANSTCSIAMAAAMTVGKSYTYSFWAKNSGGSGNTSVQANLHVLTASWALYTGSIVATSTSFIVSRSAAASQSLWIDDVELLSVEDENLLRVVSWYDQSGNARDVSQATAGLQPSFSLTALGSVAAPKFVSASSTRLDRAQDVLPTGASPCTLLAVAKRGGTEGATDTVFSIGANTAGGRPTLTLATTLERGAAEYNGGSATAANSSWPVSTARAIAGQFDNVNNTVMLNGVQTSVAAAALNVGSTAAVVGRRAGSVSPWEDAILECIAYANVSVNWAAVQTNQMGAFGL